MGPIGSPGVTGCVSVVPHEQHDDTDRIARRYRGAFPSFPTSSTTIVNPARVK